MSIVSNEEDPLAVLTDDYEKNSTELMNFILSLKTISFHLASMASAPFLFFVFCQIMSPL